MDNMDKGPGQGAGKIQSMISKALGVAQARNDSATDDLKEVQTLYEQFIRCANTLLQAITKLLENMAKHIAG